MVDARPTEGNVGGECGGVVVRTERRLALRPVLHHEVQVSKALRGGGMGKGEGTSRRGGERGKEEG